MIWKLLELDRKQKFNHMEIIDKYINKVEVANKIASSLLNTTAKTESDKSADDIVKKLKQTAYIKIPFVGEFNASKSSLLNAYMGVDLLPTNITPETAVSYELYYSTTEKLDVWHYENLKESVTLDKINEISVVPGDIVKV